MKTALLKMELAFWDTTISLMTESPIIRSCVRVGYQLVHQGGIVWLPTLILAASILGMATGYLLGASGMITW